jgi:phosphoribosylaminoimidazolecarboxamide formyltransferase/IMP cyclohydrolase
MPTVKRALVSVSDKTGIVDLCKELNGLGIGILSTGGTAKLLAENNIDVVEVSDYTGFPEMMDGRVKTLHPKIHGGLLGRRGTDDKVMQEHGIDAIALVIVNLYPFEQTVSKPDCTLADAIENIDIGGPAMLRSAAKNHASVAVVVDTADYDIVLKELKENNTSISDATRFRLAQKVFAHTANYDANVSNYLGALDETKKPLDFPLTYSMQFKKRQELRYGENPHQSAAFYTEPNPPAGTLAS